MHLSPSFFATSRSDQIARTCEFQCHYLCTPHNRYALPSSPLFHSFIIPIRRTILLHMSRNGSVRVWRFGIPVFLKQATASHCPGIDAKVPRILMQLRIVFDFKFWALTIWFGFISAQNSRHWPRYVWGSRDQRWWNEYLSLLVWRDMRLSDLPEGDSGRAQSSDTKWLVS